MICSACEGKNRDGARFCTFCGATLALRCSVCDTELLPEARFCDSCGTPVGTDAEPVAAARKVVTVLFADLTGSTAVEERMDAESVRSVLDRFYAAMRAEVERHGGRIVKFMGDGVHAVFGVPDVHEDDAARAIDAAIAMRTELEQLASDLSLDFSLKIGINTGEVVVSATDDDVVGDAVNVASRLEGVATAGEILVGSDTWRLTRGTSRYEAIEPLTLKGKSEPVPAYRLLSVDERTAEAATAPFVGRDAELGQLLSVFEDAVQANEARLVTIIGSPGLGKTRLARELMAELSGQARVRETRCDPAGSATFAPIADLLRAAAGINEATEEDQVLAALAARIPEDDPDRDRIAARAATILGVGQPGSTEETFWALRRLIEAAAAEQPVVLVLDDLQWAEPLLLDLVEHITEWIRNAPVLVVGTGRPELRDVRPSLVEGGRAAAVIALEGLDRDATARLALNLLGADELPGELLTKIPASTEGNPLFVRELVRMLVDDGVLLRTADGWTVTVDVEAIQVPPTIQSLLSARVDRLRGDERAVLEIASVVGKEFYRGALIELVPPAITELVDGCLESLRRKELVEPVGTYWIDEPVYRFHHVLIRDAAYRRLLKESRAELHERVEGWLQRKTAGVLGEHDELLGYHLEQAHDYKQQLGRGDAQLGHRAADLLGTAARRALDGDDLPAAASLSERALNCLSDDDPRRSELLLIQCEALLSIGDVAQGTRAVTEFEALANSPRLAAWAMCFAGQLANLTSSERLQDTEQAMAQSAAQLADLGDQAGAAKAHTVRAAALAGLGRFGDCEAALDDALNAARAANDSRLITATLGSLPPAALWGPNPVSRAGGRCLDVVRLLRITTGSLAVEEASRRCQAVLEAFRGRADAARRMLRTARRVLTELGLRHELLETEQFAGIVELISGDPAAALTHLQLAHDGFRATGVDVLAAQSASLLARAHLALDEETEAEAFVAISEQLGSQDLKTAIAWRSVRAEVLARRGDFDEARRLAEAAVELAEGTDASYDTGIACRSLTSVLRAAGDVDGARRAEERAHALFERKGATALIEPGAVVSKPKVDAEIQTSVAVEVSNTCTDVLERIRSTFEQQDWKTLATYYADEFVASDRRPGFQLEVDGPEAGVEYMRAIAEVGGTYMKVEPLAVRGEHLAVARFTLRGEHEEFEVQVVLLYEIDDAHRVTCWIGYEPSDLDAALLELDERFAAGEGAASSEGILLGSRFVRAINTREWDALRGLLSDDLVVIDHRPALLGEITGADEWLASLRELVGLTSTYRSAIVAHHALDVNLSLTEFRNTGSTDDGAAFEIALHSVTIVDDERLVRFEIYSPDDLPSALTRFEELRAPERSRLENLAARASDRLTDCFVRRDWSTMRTLLADESVFDDRRATLQTKLEGVDAQIKNWKAVADVGATRIDSSVVATRGDRLVLKRMLFEGTEQIEAEILFVGEVDNDGRISASFVFDPTDLDGAIEILDERYASGEAASCADVVRFASEQIRLYNARDWDAYRRTLSDDVVYLDHQPVSLGEVRGVGAWMEAVRAMSDQLAMQRMNVVSVAAIADDRALGEILSTGATPDGLDAEFHSWMLLQIRENREVRVETFPFDALDAALARFEELGRERRSAAPATMGEGQALDNQAVQVSQRLNAAWELRDWETYTELHTADCTFEDRRLGLRSSMVGGTLEGAKAAASVGADVWRLIPIAVRGEHLVLGRVVVGSSDPEAGFVVDLLQLNEIDGSGRRSRTVAFDPDDLDAAFAELDERYAMGEGAIGAELLRLGGRVTTSWNARDWVAFTEAMSPSSVYVDHRPLGSEGARGRDGLLQMIQALVDLVPDVRHDIVRILALGEHVVFCEFDARGHDREGGLVEFSYLHVIAERDGVIVSSDRFSSEQFDEAKALFEELRGRAEPLRPTAATLLENAASRVMDRDRVYEERSDWEALAADIAEDAVVEDRRSGFGWRIEGKAQVIDHVRAATTGVHVDAEVLSVRGDRLALQRQHITFNEFDIEVLTLCETDDRDRIRFTAIHDPDGLDAAFDELDDRWLASGERTEVERFTVRYFRLFNSGDWTGFGAMHADDFEYQDHRPASFGTIRGRDAFLRHLEGLAELVSDMRYRTLATYSISESVIVTISRREAIDESGNVVHWDLAGIGVARDGLAARIENFPLERFDEAVALAKKLDRTTEAGQLENASTRSGDRFYDLLARGAVDALAELIAADAVLEDRRAVLQWKLTGRGALLDHFREIGTGTTSIEHVVLALRGERLALTRYHFETRDGFEIDDLFVHEVDDQGRLAHGVAFDVEHLDAAYAELEERFAEGEGRGSAGLVRIVARLIRSLNAGDWDLLRSNLSDDLVLIDHRPISLGELRGPEAWIEALIALRELITQGTNHLVRYHALAQDRCVFEVFAHGRTLEGASVDTNFLTVIHLRDGQIVLAENFSIEQLDAALVRFEELGLQSPTEFDNVCVRLFDRMVDTYYGRDWEGFSACLNADCRVDDRRVGVSGVTEDVVSYFQASASVGVTRVHRDVLAVRGNGLALFRVSFKSDDPEPGAYEVEALVLLESADSERLKSIVVFEHDDLDGAFTELDERFAMGEGAIGAELVRLGPRVMTSWNARDWDAFAETVSPGSEYVDHRPLGFERTQGRDGMVQLARALVDLVPDVRHEIVRIHAVGEHAGLCEIEARGHDREGGMVEFSYLTVIVERDGVSVRSDRFSPEQFDEAMALFEELDRVGDAELRPDENAWRRLENSCTRNWDRMKAAYDERNWVEAGRELTDDGAFDDRRKGLAHRLEGRKAFVDQLKVIADMGAGQRNETVAIRGDRMALIRVEWYDPRELRSTTVRALHVHEVEADDRLASVVVFDDDALDAAMAELNKRYLEGDGPSHEERVVSDVLEVYNARDWDRAREILAPEMVYIDHAPASAGEIRGLDQYLRHIQQLIALVPDIRLFTVAVLREIDGCVMGLGRSIGTDEYGGGIEREHVAVFVIEGGRVVRLETFPPELFSEAHARFDELTARSNHVY